MLYYLHNLSDVFGPLRLFEYISFRAGGAFFTAFAITVLIIPFLLPFFREDRESSGKRGKYSAYENIQVDENWR